ncbi:phosphohistidine phosphatase [Allopseudospirillum japonicum]|uniref:Phosphohistidine phosphatase n=1 Tax=Allopseudospirillum japonicum TaxID=64971 RepID=A0A1H6T8J4_9GAMM|nr:histidine phosphatase family protein [Allopseudospirillum japonicum]SEI75596.1 phosphohistidine phosphatase [Allopseudospirillum japonicum]
MLKLTLWRHAKSSWKDPQLEDFMRPLNARGRKDAPEMARRIIRQCGQPTRILSSPAERTLTSARVLARQADYPLSDIFCVPGLYESSASALLAAIREYGAMASHLVLVGHMPSLGDLARQLCGHPLGHLPTAAFIHMQLSITQWCDCQGQQEAQALVFDFPKNKCVVN